MDLTFSEKEIAFRDELREWLAGNQPDAAPTEGGEDAHYALAARLAAPPVRRRLGGAGLAGRVRRPRREPDASRRSTSRSSAARACRWRPTCSACCSVARR